MIHKFEELIKGKINVDQINIIDKSGQHAKHASYTSGMHLEAVIVSDDFINKSEKLILVLLSYVWFCLI